MIRPNIWSILSIVFLGYMGHSIWTMYLLFHPKACTPGGKKNCLEPALFREGKLPSFQLRIYTSLKSTATHLGVEILKMNDFDLHSPLEKTTEFEVPEKTQMNGTLFVHVFLLPNHSPVNSPYSESWHLSQSSEITTYMVPEAATFKLVAGGTSDSNSESVRKEENVKSPQTQRKPVTHLRSVLPLAAVTDPISFEWDQVPGEIYHLLRLKGERSHQYLPIFYLNQLSFRIKDLTEIGLDTKRTNLTINYQPISVGKLRLLVTTVHSLAQLKQLGFKEKDVDEVKSIFADTNFYFLALTFSVAAVHILLDFLAFKNDIHFWRGRKTMVGLSTRTLLWRCFSQTVIFFYLFDEETSLLVLIPTGIGTVIEYWKVTKAYKLHITLISGIPRIRFGTQNEDEVQTEEFDSQGMKYLAILLIPLCLGGAVYSLLYTPHKSWLSWFIQSMANGVYAFGFLFMLPQLFVNYKLKSVAHLPWRAFMYKAFNTFIDDLFAFIITMPTAHRVACFRDDIVFLIYLYQRYLYPVDRTRVNEFGESFEPKKESKKKR